jgi:hypothetical protein
MTCKRPQTCRNCAKGHPSAACPTSKDPCTYSCSNCKSKHQIWDRPCPIRKAEAKRAAAAYATRPTLYKVNSNTTSVSQNLPIHFHSTPHPTPFSANQGQQPSQPRTTRKWARQSTVPAAGEPADDVSVATPEQVGSMEGISLTPSQPPNAASTIQTMSLPAFPASLSSTPPQTRPRVASMMTARPRSPSTTL